MRVPDTNIVVYNTNQEAQTAVKDNANTGTTIHTLCVEWSANQISQTLLPYNNLRVMILTGAKFGNEGALKIAEVIKTKATVMHLSLEWCNIKQDGAKAIANAFMECTSLCYLNLWDNKIGDAAQTLNALVQKQPNIFIAIYKGWEPIEQIALKRKNVVHSLVKAFESRATKPLTIDEIKLMQTYETAMTYIISSYQNNYHLDAEANFKKDLSVIVEYANKSDATIQITR